MKMNAGQAVVEVLAAEGVTTVFGMPGGHTLPIYDALFQQETIRHILVRHEQIAASMAAAYAQLTGEPGVACVTAGPGATNLLTGVTEAHIGATPMVLLAARGSTVTTYRGASQEARTDRVFEPVTKWATRIDNAGQIVEVLRRAFTLARTGKPGPVYIDIPRDLLLSEIEFGPYSPVGRPVQPRANAAQVEAAAKALASARAPIVVAGGGAVASGAQAGIRRIAEGLAAPVLTSLAGRGAIPDDHPLSAGGLGCHRNELSKDLLGKADVVLSLGTRFEEMETNWRPGFVPAPGATVIQVDTDPGEMGKSIAATIGVTADASAFLEDLGDALDRAGALQPGFESHERTAACTASLNAIRADIAEMAASLRRPLHPMRVIDAARRIFPRQTIVGFDVGVLAQQVAGAQPYFPIYEPRSTIVPSSFYGMGYVSAGLPAAKVVHPDRPALGFVGDGSFQLVMPVLPTAAEAGLAVTWVILNDRALGSIRDIQKYAYGNRVLGTSFDLDVDFAMLARACGCFGLRIDDPAAVDDALAQALAANGKGQPAVLDFRVGDDRLFPSIDFYTFYESLRS